MYSIKISKKNILTEKEFKTFYDCNFDSIRSYLFYRSGNGDLASDLAQDTLIRIWEKDIKNEGKKTIGLAYKIAKDLFVNSYRRANSAANYAKSLEFEFTNTSPEEELLYMEMKEKYEKTLADLNEKQRVVFLMSRLEGLKYQEIADRIGISVKAVEKRMSGALTTFREVLRILFYLLYFSVYADRSLLIFNNI